jgi:hypothetical protein
MAVGGVYQLRVDADAVPGSGMNCLVSNYVGFTLNNDRKKRIPRERSCPL